MVSCPMFRFRVSRDGQRNKVVQQRNPMSPTTSSTSMVVASDPDRTPTPTTREKHNCSIFKASRSRVAALYKL